MERIKLLVIAGPTASGKSDLAIRLARRFNGEIISADSRQVYRSMDIGTGKVTKAEQKLAHHWLLDVASPKRQYSVAQWKWAAQHAIRDIARRSKVPIICGGTGFWIDALVYDLALPEVKPDAKLRARLQKLSPVQLFARLKKLDPARAATIDRQNPRRLIRALEIIAATGKPVPAQVQSEKFKVKSGLKVLYLGIDVPNATLKRRIAKRLDARLKADMVAEVKKLRAQGIGWKRLENFGLEYRWISRYLQNKTTRTDMRDGLLRDIIAYSKRQMTWFHRNPDIHWVTSRPQTARLVKKFLKA